jgi:hypothetical protein
LKHTLNTNKSKIRLTKSPAAFIFVVFGLLILLCSSITLVVWTASDVLIVKLLTVLISAIALVLTYHHLTRLSEAFLLSDMIIVEPFIGKKIITPFQGVVVKKSFLLGMIQICKIHIRLDGKKSVHLLYGKCDEIICEKSKIEDFLRDLKQNKKVNHKPGSVSSVA